jgi:hypothetical protein
LVTPGFSLTCGIVDVAFFGVLWPLIKDFFWIAIVIPPCCRFFWISLPPQLLGIVYSTGDAKVVYAGRSEDGYAESMSCGPCRGQELEASPSTRLIINLSSVNY